MLSSEDGVYLLTGGINCYVAENEAGKTTMVAGLIATLFGLKHHQKVLRLLLLIVSATGTILTGVAVKLYLTVGKKIPDQAGF